VPKIQGLWRPRTKIDEAEFESAKTRTAARLADLFAVDTPVAPGDGPPVGSGDDVAEPGTSTHADDALETGLAAAAPEPSGRRPPIVVEAGPGLVGVMAEPDQAAPDLVGVMARPGGSIAAAPPSDLVAPTDADSPSEPVAASDPVASSDPVTPTDANSPSDPVVGAGRSRRRKAPVDPTESGRASAGAQRTHPRGTGAGRPVSTRSTARRKAAPAPACPYCAVLLQPAPVSSQRCARCHQRIIVKRADGRTVYLTEAAVPVFQAERRRVASAGRLNRDRARWLKLAAAAGAPADRAARLSAAEVSDQVVEGCRALYLGTVEQSFRAARRERRWEDASRIRRAQALALYRVAGSPVPPPEGVVRLHRDGTAAELRAIAEIAREAELVGAACCDTCRAEDGRILRITAELRVPRLPHEGCPKGLCRCRWDLPAPYRTTVRRYLLRRARADTAPGTGELPPTARGPIRPRTGPA
jgi:hypothetical protein